MRHLNAPILYLDFDGVLHHGAVFIDRKRGIHIREPGYELFEWAHLLKGPLDVAPDVAVVLSTSWHFVRGFRFARTCLPKWLQTRIVGGTLHKRYSGVEAHFWHRMTRYEQIQSHIARRQIRHWCALDDDDSGWPNSQRDRLILTRESTGLAGDGVVAELHHKLQWIQSEWREEREFEWPAAKPVKALVSVTAAQISLQANRIIALATYVWGNEQDARDFMAAPHSLLGGKSPMEVAATEEGVQKVAELLWQIYYGLPQ